MTSSRPPMRAQPVSCAITLEKDSPITKDGKGSVRCDADITENTDN